MAEKYERHASEYGSCAVVGLAMLSVGATLWLNFLGV